MSSLLSRKRLSRALPLTGFLGDGPQLLVELFRNLDFGIPLVVAEPIVPIQGGKAVTIARDETANTVILPATIVVGKMNPRAEFISGLTLSIVDANIVAGSEDEQLCARIKRIAVVILFVQLEIHLHGVHRLAPQMPFILHPTYVLVEFVADDGPKDVANHALALR